MSSREQTIDDKSYITSVMHSKKLPARIFVCVNDTETCKLKYVIS
jgi:hypothetical protein